MILISLNHNFKGIWGKQTYIFLNQQIDLLDL